MGGMTPKPVLQVFATVTTLLAMLILIPASGSDTHCKDPGHISNGRRKIIMERGIDVQQCCPPGTLVYYTCAWGYRLVGRRRIRCGANGTWNHAWPKCKPEGACDDFEVAHGRLVGHRSAGDFFAPGDKAFVKCDPGFRVDTTTEHLLCEGGGNWDKLQPTCVAEEACDDFEVAHGRLVGHRSAGDFFAPGDTAFVKCDHGFRVDTTDQLLCERGGKWDKLVPTCVEITCGHLRAPQHGWMIEANSTAVGSSARFGCFQGYVLMGSQERECHDDGEWSGSPVRCVPHGKANIGGSVDKVTIGSKKVEVYCIGITGSAHMETLTKLASTPTSTHLFKLRNYDALQWLAETNISGTIDYGVCGISNEHRLDTGFEDIDEPQSRIINGQGVLHAWPWMVAISLTGQPYLVVCGGTIIANRWILTAAHCMYSKTEKRYLRPTDIHVRARLISTKGNLDYLEDPKSTEPLPTGELNTPKELLVEAIVLHENYNPTSKFLNDIALLRLKENITYEKFIRPICLPPAKGNIPRESTFYKKAARAVVIGWGTTRTGSMKSAERLQQLEKEIGSEEDCRKDKRQGDYRAQGMMCAKSVRGDACFGDSGGPLMQAIKTDDTVWTQVGIVSWGVGCKADRYSFYTDVSYYVPWIRSHLDV